MKNLIRKILKESEFDWVEKANVTDAVSFCKYGKHNKIDPQLLDRVFDKLKSEWKIDDVFGLDMDETLDEFWDKWKDLGSRGVILIYKNGQIKWTNCPTWGGNKKIQARSVEVDDLFTESEFDWTNEVGPMSMSNDYVIDVSKFSRQNLTWFLDDLRELGYSGTSEIPNNAHFIYMEYTNGNLVLDWDGPHNGPTIGGDYHLIDIDKFNEMFYYWKIERDKGVLHESEFDWVNDSEMTSNSVAKDILDKTEITPNVFMGDSMIKVPFTTLQYSEPEYFSSVVDQFNNYIKNHYGRHDRMFIDDVWNRWITYTKQKMN